MRGSALANRWTFDPTVDFLNHGSFGATQISVLQRQSELRAQMEREPIQFFLHTMTRLLDEARAALATLVGAAEDELVFVPNATHGVSTVLGSLDIHAGDELLATSHGYNACTNALRELAERRGASVVIADVPFPIASKEAAFDAVVGCFNDKTRLLLIDHVTSPTGIILPIERIIEVARARGITVLVDGAHAPGMLPLSLSSIGADFYTGNLHKWISAPKGAGFLHVRRPYRDKIRPLVISHGRNSPRTDRHKMLIEFDWMGTVDPTPYLCLPAALDALASLDPAGLAGVMANNRALALRGRDLLIRTLEQKAPAPDDMIGSLATVRISDLDPSAGSSTQRPDAFAIDPTQRALFDVHHIEVPVMPWPKPPHRLLRIAAAPYNDFAQYQRLADALVALGVRGPEGGSHV